MKIYVNSLIKFRIFSEVYITSYVQIFHFLSDQKKYRDIARIFVHVHYETFPQDFKSYQVGR